MALVAQSSAQLSTPQYVIRDDAPRTGSILRHRQAAKFPIPVNRSYDKLTPEQKAVVHSWYEHMELGDEPPFPADGLVPLYDAIQRGQRKLMVRGELEMAVTVGPDGKATEVHVMKSPSPEMTQFVGSVLLLTKYKPAVCKGLPCRMQFPLSLRFDPGREEDLIRSYRPDNWDP
ncbi:MAG: energy transducer TonB [Burkholderiales bacterium]